MGFEELEDSLAIETKPVIIYFYTNWCLFRIKSYRNAESEEKTEFENKYLKNSGSIKPNFHPDPNFVSSQINKPIFFPKNGDKEQKNKPGT